MRGANVTYGSGVVGLAKVAVDTTGRGGVDDTTVFLLEEVGPGSLGDLVGAAQMHVEDGVPERVVHVGKSLVAEDTGVVDNDVNAAKVVNGSLDNRVTILGRGLDADSLAAGLLDLVYDIVRVGEIVDDNGGAVLGKGQAVGTTNTSTATRDQGDPASEVDLAVLLTGTHLLRLLEKCHEVIGAAGVLRVGEVDNVIPLLEDGAGSVRAVGLEEQATRSLPSELGSMATTNFENATVLGGVAGVDKNSNERDNPLGLELLKNVGGHDGGGHSAGSCSLTLVTERVLTLADSSFCSASALTNRSNHIAHDVVLGTLLGESLGETDHGQLGSRVVGLAKVAEQTGSRGSIDDTAILLFPEMRPGSAGNLVGTFDVDFHNEVPVLVRHILEADIP